MKIANPNGRRQRILEDSNNDESDDEKRLTKWQVISIIGLAIMFYVLYRFIFAVIYA